MKALTLHISCVTSKTHLISWNSTSRTSCEDTWNKVWEQVRRNEYRFDAAVIRGLSLICPCTYHFRPRGPSLSPPIQVQAFIFILFNSLSAKVYSSHISSWHYPRIHLQKLLQRRGLVANKTPVYRIHIPVGSLFTSTWEICQTETKCPFCY